MERPPRPDRGTRRRRAAVVAVAAVGAALIGAGLSRAETGNPRVEVRDPAVERRIPGPGEQVLRQDRVGVDLAPGYVGEITIDDVLIPRDQYVLPDPPPGVARDARDLSLNPLNEFVFQPGQGRVIEELEPGEHTVVARFWEERLGEDDDRTDTWTFRVAG